MSAMADVITVPNGSFESPVAVGPNYFAMLTEGTGPSVGDWASSAAHLSGVFKNTGMYGNVITNAVGNQVAFQDGFSGAQTWQDLTATYTAGNAYTLTVGVAGRSDIAQPTNPEQMEVRLFYRDAETKAVTVAYQTVNYTDLSTSAFTDYTVSLPAVSGSDAWAGKTIGIQFYCTWSDPLSSQYFSLDNVRLSSAAVPEPASMAIIVTGLAGLLAYAWRKRK
jgi:hypothetical protein